MTKLDDPARLGHMLESAKMAVQFIENETRASLDSDGRVTAINQSVGGGVVMGRDNLLKTLDAEASELEQRISENMILILERA